MKNLTKFVVGLAVGAFTMTACGQSWKKVDFDTFVDKAVEAIENGADKQPCNISLKMVANGETSKMEIKNLDDSTKTEFYMDGEKLDLESEEGAMTFFMAAMIIEGSSLSAFGTIAEDSEEFEYYVSGKKLKCTMNMDSEESKGKASYIWNEYGWLTNAEVDGKQRTSEIAEWQDIKETITISYSDIKTIELE